jgi:hypothetical protein
LTGRLPSLEQPRPFPKELQSSTTSFNGFVDTRRDTGTYQNRGEIKTAASKQIGAEGTPTDQENNQLESKETRKGRRDAEPRDDPADTVFRFTAATRLRR